MRLRTMLGRTLTRHLNFNEYWICATCKRPRRKSTVRERACVRCGCQDPPLKGITHRRGERGAHSDSRYSKKMTSIASDVRRSLRMGTNEFPQGNPTRDLLSASRVYRAVPDSPGWFTQVFIGSEVYVGTLPFEVCLTRSIDEVIREMSDKKMMQIRIPPDLHKWFKLYATKNETTMTEVLINYLQALRRREEQSVNVEQF